MTAPIPEQPSTPNPGHDPGRSPEQEPVPERPERHPKQPEGPPVRIIDLPPNSPTPGIPVQ
jgi:hypothetical protein